MINSLTLSRRHFPWFRSGKRRAYGFAIFEFSIRIETLGADDFAIPGSEGTFGGLAESGRRIGEHLLAAIEEARLCSNDPVCAEQDTSAEHDPMHLLGAACHGCLLIAETSCEQRNDWLDRALVVPTLAVTDAAFFP